MQAFFRTHPDRWRWVQASLFVVIIFGSGGAGAISSGVADAAESETPTVDLPSGSRVALLGGSWVERLQNDGVFEATLHCELDLDEVSFRNLGWSGDDVHGYARKVFDEAEEGEQRRQKDLELAEPSHIWIAYGASEASDGEIAVRSFAEGLRRLLDSLPQHSASIALITPPRMPGYEVADYDRRLDEIRTTIRRIANQRTLPVLADDFVASTSDVAPGGLAFSGDGARRFAQSIAGDLGGDGADVACADRLETLAAAVREKDRLFLHRHRPQNETYLFLFRKHEQGQNAAEVERFDELIRAADRRIWQSASGG